MRVLLGLGACLLLVAADEAADPLVGVWKLRSVVAGGQTRVEKARTTFTFKNSKLVMKNRAKELVYSYTLDPSKKPAAIDLVGEGRYEGVKSQGIYEVDGDELKLSIASSPEDPKDPRPKGFTGDHLKGCTLFTLKRDTASDKEQKSTDLEKAEKKDKEKP